MNFYEARLIRGIGPEQEHGTEILWPGKKAAFGCNANHGRSQFAEILFRKKYSNIEVISGGSICRINEYENNAPNPIVVQVLQEHDINPKELYVKQLGRDVVTRETDLITFIPPNLFSNEILDGVRSTLYIPMEDPSVSVFTWGEQPPVKKSNVEKTFLEMQDLIENKLSNYMLEIRQYEKELAEMNIHYPISTIFMVSGQTISRVPRYSYERR